MARRPDLFQLCPGKKTFSPVGLDSLDIHRGQRKTGGLRYHMGGGSLGRRGFGEGGVMSQERCVLILFWYCKDMAFAALTSKKSKICISRENTVSELARC